MKSINQIFALFAFMFIVSCSSDDSSPSQTGNDNSTPSVSTNMPTEVTGTTAVLGGTVTSDGGGNVETRGVCWSLNSNPTVSDLSQAVGGSGLGSYSITVEDLMPNTTYHVRAFAINSNGGNVAYGSNMTFTTEGLVTFNVDIPRNINTTRFDVDVVISSSSPNNVGERGVVVDTSPNPTIDDIQVNGGHGVGEYGGQVSGFNPNTVYYVRPYVYSYIDDEFIYGEEHSFRTTGYFGEAGGYVVFDKGETTEGWRYLEASPEQSSFYNDWGCSGSFMSNTFEDFGKGLDNTNHIVSNCGEASYAAKTALNYSYGGYSDWFLPSRLEAIVTMRSLMDLNALENIYHWTSTEINSNQAYVIYASGDDIISSANGKGTSNSYLPIRRY